jgi:hypothetical protein
MQRILITVFLLIAIAAPAVLYAIQAQQESLEARVAAFKHESGNIEFAIQVKDSDGWGERVLPRARTLGGDAPTGRWFISSAVELEIPETDTSLLVLEPVGDVHFDVAIVVKGDGQVVVEAEIDGERFEWPTRVNLSDDIGSDLGSTPTYRFAPNDWLDEETLTWKENNFWGFSVDIREERGLVVVITPKVHRTGSFYAPTWLFVGGAHRMLVEDLKQSGRYDFPPFALSGQNYQRIRATPCTADDIYGLPRYLDPSIVAYAFEPDICYVREGRTVRRDASGNLYGLSGERLGCRYSVDVTPINSQFARVSYTFDRGCELRLVGGGNTQVYYLVGDIEN